MDLTNVGRFFGRNARKTVDHTAQAAVTLTTGVKAGWIDESEEQSVYAPAPKAAVVKASARRTSTRKQ